jgi:hypothetical protein
MANPGGGETMMLIRAVPLLVLAAGPTARAETISADSALKRYRSQFPSVAELDCPRASDAIVVCGHSGPDPNRPPIPYQPKPGDTAHLLPGEPLSAAAALDPAHMCTRDCPEPVEGSIMNVFKAVGHLLGKDR